MTTPVPTPGEALKRYGMHDRDCENSNGVAPCSCGFSTVLARLEQP
jgi:hypothetical protein